MRGFNLAGQLAQMESFKEGGGSSVPTILPTIQRHIANELLPLCRSDVLENSTGVVILAKNGIIII